VQGKVEEKIEVMMLLSCNRNDGFENGEGISKLCRGEIILTDAAAINY
jgi:hypothetical protein